MSSIYKSKILLRRKNANFEAGFCLINKKLPELIKEISILHPDEIEYYKTLKFDRRKASYLLGRIAAKNALSEILYTDQVIQSIAIQFGVFQFPVVKHLMDQNIQVSISHSDDYGIALAFPEEHPLGIDIEKIEEQKIDTMKSVISDKEFERIESSSLALLVACPIIWTIKEGLSKVLKTGQTMDFKILEIESIEKVGHTYISTFRHFSQYKGISFQIGNHICSITLPRNTSLDLKNLLSTLNL